MFAFMDTNGPLSPETPKAEHAASSVVSVSTKHFWLGSVSFDSKAFETVIRLGNAHCDSATEKAMFAQASLVGALAIGDSRSSLGAITKVNQILRHGYNFARFLLGTYDSNRIFSTTESSEADSERLFEQMEDYPAARILIDGLARDARSSLLSHAEEEANNREVFSHFGQQLSQPFVLMILVDAIHLALAESDLFFMRPT
jgi:hypothetical protein